MVYEVEHVPVRRARVRDTVLPDGCRWRSARQPIDGEAQGVGTTEARAIGRIFRRTPFPTRRRKQIGGTLPVVVPGIHRNGHWRRFALTFHGTVGEVTIRFCLSSVAFREIFQVYRSSSRTGLMDHCNMRLDENDKQKQKSLVQMSEGLY